jgi:hypothetical protein
LIIMSLRILVQEMPYVLGAEDRFGHRTPQVNAVDVPQAKIGVRICIASM